jgi:hypothetical protein
MADAQLEILALEGFEWDENKSKANFEKHDHLGAPCEET